MKVLLTSERSKTWCQIDQHSGNMYQKSGIALENEPVLAAKDRTRNNVFPYILETALAKG